MSSRKATLLLVEDDPKMIKLLEPALKRAGYAVRLAKNADQAFAAVEGDLVDLVLLDYQLPGISGLKLLEILKQDPRTARLPVIMQTLRGAESDKVAGLKTGADDYIVKPFSMPELLARVEALLRRSRHEGRTGRVIESGGLRLDLDSRQAAVGSESVELTRAEFDLLVKLAERPGRVLSYAVLSEALSEGAKIMSSENLYWHVRNLRRKLGAAGDAIETVHGVGYRFKAG